MAPDILLKISMQARGDGHPREGSMVVDYRTNLYLIVNQFTSPTFR
jgi:hypothetical protein